MVPQTDHKPINNKARAEPRLALQPEMNGQTNVFQQINILRWIYVNMAKARPNPCHEDPLTGHKPINYPARAESRDRH